MPDALRSLMMARKGPAVPSAGAAPGLTIHVGHSGAGGPPAGDDMPPAGEGVTCPGCGCQFDPASGEIMGGDGDYGTPVEDAPPEAGLPMSEPAA